MALQLPDAGTLTSLRKHSFVAPMIDLIQADNSPPAEHARGAHSACSHAFHCVQTFDIAGAKD